MAPRTCKLRQVMEIQQRPLTARRGTSGASNCPRATCSRTAVTQRGAGFCTNFRVPWQADVDASARQHRARGTHSASQVTVPCIPRNKPRHEQKRAGENRRKPENYDWILFNLQNNHLMMYLAQSQAQYRHLQAQRKFEGSHPPLKLKNHWAALRAHGCLFQFLLSHSLQTTCIQFSKICDR